MQKYWLSGDEGSRRRRYFSSDELAVISEFYSARAAFIRFLPLRGSRNSISADLYQQAYQRYLRSFAALQLVPGYHAV
jgi:hypothetical protein